jgi:ribosomal protein S18 acetylase RimI-like enzyme
MKIREYKKSEEKKVKEMIQSVLDEIYPNNQKINEWEDFAKYSVIYVAEEKGKIIGSVAVKKVDGNTVKLKRMYVDVQSQRKGIGQKLMNKVLDYCKINKFKEMVLTTYAEMASAVKFYQKNGFEIVKNPTDKYFSNPSLKDYNNSQIAMRREL